MKITVTKSDLRKALKATGCRYTNRCLVAQAGKRHGFQTHQAGCSGKLIVSSDLDDLMRIYDNRAQLGMAIPMLEAVLPIELEV